VAYNYRWSWLPGGPELFRSVDPIAGSSAAKTRFASSKEASAEALARAAGDDDFLARAASLENTIRADLARPPAPGSLTPERPVAFLCAEYGLHPSLPIYSGLGALAGDFLKEASDRGLPCVAVGLMDRQGYFRQRLDASGWQHE
jgi:starch phosphorylase